MNKSEIAEKYAREIVGRVPLVSAYGSGWQEHEYKLIEISTKIVERAIAESRGQPCPHLNRVKSTEPGSATLCTDCDTYLPKSELGDGEPSPFPQPSVAPKQLVAELKAARTAWHEAHGVPISFEYARFLDAIGNLTDWIEGSKT